MPTATPPPAPRALSTFPPGAIVISPHGRRVRVVVEPPATPSGAAQAAATPPPEPTYRAEMLQGPTAGRQIVVPSTWACWPDCTDWTEPKAGAVVRPEDVTAWFEARARGTAGAVAMGPAADGAAPPSIPTAAPPSVEPGAASHRAERAAGRKRRAAAPVVDAPQVEAPADNVAPPSAAPAPTALHVARVEHSIKAARSTPVVAALGPLTLIEGPNGSGKTSLVNAVELAVTGEASDLQGRAAVRADHLLAALGARAGRIEASIALSDGTTASWSLGKAKPGRAGTATTAGKAVATASRPFKVAFPLRDVLAALRGKAETTEAFLLQHVGVDTLETAGIQAACSPAAWEAARGILFGMEGEEDGSCGGDDGRADGDEAGKPAGSPAPAPRAIPVASARAAVQALQKAQRAHEASAAAARIAVDEAAARVPAGGAPDLDDARDRVRAAQAAHQAALARVSACQRALRWATTVGAEAARVEERAKAAAASQEAELEAARTRYLASKAAVDKARVACDTARAALDGATARLDAHRAAGGGTPQGVNAIRARLLPVLADQRGRAACLVCGGTLSADRLAARTQDVQARFDAANEAGETWRVEEGRLTAERDVAERAHRVAETALTGAIAAAAALRQAGLDLRARIEAAAAARGEGDSPVTPVTPVAPAIPDDIPPALATLPVADLAEESTRATAAAEAAGQAVRGADAALAALMQEATAADDLEAARKRLATAEDAARAADTAAAAIEAVSQRAFMAAAGRFEAAVQRYLPDGLRFGLQLRDGDKDVVRWGVRRMRDGRQALDEALCGAEWSQIVVALSLACVPPDCDFAVVSPEDRAWDRKTLGGFLRAVAAGVARRAADPSAGPPVQVLVTSTALPARPVDGWTVIRLGERGGKEDEGDGVDGGDGVAVGADDAGGIPAAPTPTPPTSPSASDDDAV